MRFTIPLLLATLLLGPGTADALDQPRLLNEAIRAQRRVAQARPNDAGVLNDLGNLLTLADNLEAAEEVYRQALVIDPENATTHYNLALMLRLDGRPRPALRELKRAVELNPDDAWGHYELGVLLEERDKTDKAAHHFARAFVLDPSLAEFETNPQLLDSNLTTRAMMIAYQERVASFEMAPRRYAQPKRITRLLVPEVGSPAREAKPGAGKKKKKKADPPEAEPKKRRTKSSETGSDDNGS